MSKKDRCPHCNGYMPDGNKYCSYSCYKNDGGTPIVLIVEGEE